MAADDILSVLETKRRGDDPELDALMDELAKETGDPLFWDVRKYAGKEKEEAGPGVIVAGGLNEAKAHVKGIKPPAATSGKAAAEEDERVVVTTEAERREAIAAALRASQGAAKRGAESARRDEAEREVERARKEEAERTTAVRAVSKKRRSKKRNLKIGAVALLIVVVASGAYVLGMRRGAEPVETSATVPVQAAVNATSVAPAATPPTPVIVPTSEPAPGVSATPTSAPASPSASPVASSDAKSGDTKHAPGGATNAAPARPKANGNDDNDPYATPPGPARGAEPKGKLEEKKPPATSMPSDFTE